MTTTIRLLLFVSVCTLTTWTVIATRRLRSNLSTVDDNKNNNNNRTPSGGYGYGGGGGGDNIWWYLRNNEHETLEEPPLPPPPLSASATASSPSLLRTPARMPLPAFTWNEIPLDMQLEAKGRCGVDKCFFKSTTVPGVGYLVARHVVDDDGSMFDTMSLGYKFAKDVLETKCHAEHLYLSEPFIVSANATVVTRLNDMSSNHHKLFIREQKHQQKQKQEELEERKQQRRQRRRQRDRDRHRTAEEVPDHSSETDGHHHHQYNRDHHHRRQISRYRKEEQQHHQRRRRQNELPQNPPESRHHTTTRDGDRSMHEIDHRRLLRIESHEEESSKHLYGHNRRLEEEEDDDDDDDDDGDDDDDDEQKDPSGGNHKAKTMFPIPSSSETIDFVVQPVRIAPSITLEFGSMNRKMEYTVAKISEFRRQVVGAIDDSNRQQKKNGEEGRWSSRRRSFRRNLFDAAKGIRCALQASPTHQYWYDFQGLIDLEGNFYHTDLDSQFWNVDRLFRRRNDKDDGDDDDDDNGGDSDATTAAPVYLDQQQRRKKILHFEAGVLHRFHDVIDRLTINDVDDDEIKSEN